MYESPINIEYTTDQMFRAINEHMDDAVYQAVINCGIHINKYELIKAISYDRGQYEKGFTDGIELFVTRLKEALTEHIKPTDIHDESELDLNSDIVWDTIDTVKEAFNV
jgi:hypothetical protein